MSVIKFVPARLYGISRRRLLKVIGTGLATGLVSPIAFKAFATETQNSSADLDRFMSASKALTEKQDLNPIIAQRLYHLLAKQPGFAAALADLQLQLSKAPEQWSASQQKTANEILSAWYLGKVGEGTQAQVVSYEKALMFDAVAGALVIRSYCSGRPGYWAARPEITA